jgi:branched-subunit amino acid aminotransferase/4-amino-4-deoxychorismate lyase
MELKTITKDNFFQGPRIEKRHWQKDYLAMYSSLWPGITTDPALMMLPIDDHLVHRGDGVFDVMRCVRGKIYQMEEHLERLNRSANAISLGFPPDYDHIREVMKALILTGREKDCLIRVIVSRGPGSFSTNPYDCPSSQLYVNVIRFRSLPDRYYTEGASIITSKIPIKHSFFANIKSCNYLPNVLMKMEAIDAGCQYSLALDEEGFLAEGSTENVGVLAEDGVLKFPGFERTLSGTTARRVFELADDLVKKGMIRGVKYAKITLQEAYKAKEMFLTGTSINILPVVSYDGKAIGKGSPGPVYSELASLLWKDMTENRQVLTEIAWESRE